MALFTTSRPKIAVKSISRFPARVTADTGIDLTISNGEYNFSLDYTQLGTETISNPADWTILGYHEPTGEYRQVAVNSLSNFNLDFTVYDLATPTDARQWTVLGYNSSTLEYHQITGYDLAIRYHADTVADFEATSFDPAAHSVELLGYYTIGVGSFNVRRVSAEPEHPWKFRSLDRYMPDETIDNVNGGWWEGYADANVVAIESFGGAGDYLGTPGTATDNLAAWDDFQLWAAWLATNAPGGLWYGMPTCLFSIGSYYFSQYANVYAACEVRGLGGSTAFPISASWIVFPTDGPGFIVNSANTDGLTPGVVASRTYSGQGTKFRGLTISTEAGWTDDYSTFKPFKPYCFGVWMRAMSDIAECACFGWAYAGIGTYATTSGPPRGNSCGFSIRRVQTVNCAIGIYHEGDNANAGTVMEVSVKSGLMGYLDSSFLGNNLYSAQAAQIGNTWSYRWNTCGIVAFNGYHYYLKPTSDYWNRLIAAQTTPPTGAASDNAVWGLYVYSSGGATVSIPTWGVVKDDDNLIYTVVPGQEASMWTSKPSTHPTVWGTGVSPSGSTKYITWANAAQQATGTGDYVDLNGTTGEWIVGPYTYAMSFATTNLNNRASLTALYTEGDSEGGAYFGRAYIQAGINSQAVLKESQQPVFWASDGELKVTGGGWLSPDVVYAAQYTMSPSAIIADATTARTLSATDNGRVLYFTSGSAITLTCAASLGAGFSCTIIQGGTGQITVSAGAATLVSRGSLTKTNGQYAQVSLISPVANTFVLSGDMA